MKKQIEFDFALWGKEGISIESTNGGNAINVIPLKKAHNTLTHLIEFENSCPCLVDIYGSWANVTLKMYEETKPLEFWANVYDGGSLNLYANQKDAEQAYKNSIKDAPAIKGKTIKLREVEE